MLCQLPPLVVEYSHWPVAPDEPLAVTAIPANVLATEPVGLVTATCCWSVASSKWLLNRLATLCVLVSGVSSRIVVVAWVVPPVTFGASLTAAMLIVLG